MHEDPKSATNTVNVSVFFELLGSAHIKAVRKIFIKLTHGVNFTNTLRAAFLTKMSMLLLFAFEIFCQKNNGKKLIAMSILPTLYCTNKFICFLCLLFGFVYWQKSC